MVAAAARPILFIVTMKFLANSLERQEWIEGVKR
jgi:hypothetical protein